MPPWADAEALVRAGKIVFNELSEGIDRRSHTGRYELNPDGYVDQYLLLT